SATLTASSADTDIAQVEFFECSNASTNCSSGSWNSVGTDTTSPYSLSWTVPASDGNKAVRAVATDGSSNTGSDVANVLIDRTDRGLARILRVLRRVRERRHRVLQAGGVRWLHGDGDVERRAVRPRLDGVPGPRRELDGDERRLHLLAERDRTERQPDRHRHE